MDIAGRDAAVAKERFATAVKDGISALMTRCGYSRERATSALLRELTKGEDRGEEEQVRLFA